MSDVYEYLLIDFEWKPTCTHHQVRSEWEAHCSHLQGKETWKTLVLMLTRLLSGSHPFWLKKLSAKIIKSILTANSKWDVFKTIKRTMKVKGNSLSKKVLNHSHTSIKLNILILRCRNSQEEVFFLSILFIRVFWAKSPTHTDVPLSFHSIEI